MTTEPTPTLDACYTQFGFRIHQRALSILGNEEDAGDCVQQVFVRLAAALSGFEGRSSISTWIYVVTTREALMMRRSYGRRRARDDQWAREVAPVPSGLGGRLEARELIGQLEQVLDEPLLEVAVLYFVDELGQAEIGRLLGVSRRTVIRRLNEVRAQADALSLPADTENAR